MSRSCFPFLCVFLVFSSGAYRLGAQAKPTAERNLHPSVFGLLSGTFTGLSGSPYNTTTTNPGLGGRNLTLAAGGDFGVLPIKHYDLAAEVRGSYPLQKGKIDAEKAILAGLRISREPGSTGLFSHLRPYADLLVGRGAIEYVSGGYAVPGLLYKHTSSTVYDLGGGFETDITQHYSIKADAQVQHWSTPVLPSGRIYPVTAGLGLTYRFGAGEGPR